MAKTVIHMQWRRKNASGGEVNGTRCNRLRILADGMNLTDEPALVTCKFCLRQLENPTKHT